MRFDVAIVGAGPAGLACSATLAERGLTVALIDEQPSPGGQVWRNIEAADRFADPSTIWSDYEAGRAAVARFRRSGCTYLPKTQVFQIEPGWRLFANSGATADLLEADRLVLAVGAQERPMPFAGWQLPGVMTVGAAQILLKTSGTVPETAPWLAGSGPLLLYYASQLLAMGVRPAGIIDLRPPQPVAVRQLLGAVRANAGALLKGARWLAALRTSGVPIIRARQIAVRGGERLEFIEITRSNGEIRREAASILLVHDGVVPRTHEGAMAGARYRWDEALACVVAAADGEPDAPVIVGDAARIGGATSALAEGQLAGLDIAAALGKAQPSDSGLRAMLAKSLAAERALRGFLDHHYPPRPVGDDIADETVICRCEEITAGTIRAHAADVAGIDELKAHTRIGMGRCQGRNCAAVAARLLAHHSGKPQENFAYRVRPPARAIRIDELARLPTEPKP
ncbi:MAG TPA: NAD(P)/FAD-dependent oxidoreductase [Devosia sp.]|nr:NAD(P)/FAD-dependent oxidoreductase [Devosia sp.]